MVGSGEGLVLVAETLLLTWPETGPAALAAPADSREPNSRVSAKVVEANLRSIVSPG